ncbi:hypothetical protein AcW1_006281 [Taiwanofungus camphoratus]|nr:hypothetical protein AcW2_005035 [Antrodia cinnamomea]KAI0934910.1 hypothetical protein AcV5_006601 [Antrodia cinnamomea]KAI0949802.1 hypothetical protein AcV7_008464 [Antrodia cinnamomea]KAI0958106.1 hypothetical protein AcW1_006281 [Antrodia cinnamomea]
MIFQLISRCFRWLARKASSKIQDAVLTILAAGPVPRHIAFVMDGNRRYARLHHKQISEGHSEGFLALRRMLEICMQLHVRCVTAYAFAIENFKRSPEEVDALMNLAVEKLVEISQHGDLLDEYGVRLNVLGKTERLPPKVQAAIHKAENMSRNNNRAILNICMPYAARDDIATAVESAVRLAVEKGGHREITEEDIDAQLMTSVVGSPPLDVLIRTSGVKRLSDFLLWQVGYPAGVHIQS